MGYRSSRYNFIVGGETGPTGVFNTLSGALSVLDADEWAKAGPALIDRGSRIGFDGLLLEALVAQGHVVDEDFDEREVVLARKRAGIDDSNRLDVVVMPTLDCDFRCVYCYEEHRPERMSAETVEAVSRFLEREIPRFKGVLLQWYGGEPLLQKRIVSDVSRRAARAARDAGVLITIQMTTNGYNLDEATCAELTSIGLREFQITVDGYGAHHDALRPHRTGRPTYARVVGNAIALLRAHAEVQLSVRVNFNHTNHHAVERLFSEFPSELRSRARFIFEPIFGACSMRARTHLDDAAISATIKTLHARATEEGYATSLSGVHAGKLVYCYAERENQVVLSPSGDVYKCAVGTFEPRQAVGRLLPSGEIERFDAWSCWTGDPILSAACLDCVHVPLCMGGCRKERASRGEGGDACALVPQNVSSVLKMIALEGDDGLAPLLGLGSEIMRGGNP